MVKQIVFNGGVLLAQRGNASSYHAIARRVFAQLGARMGRWARSAPAAGRALRQVGDGLFDLSDPATVLSLLEEVQAQAPPGELVAISAQVLQVGCVERKGRWEEEGGKRGAVGKRAGAEGVGAGWGGAGRGTAGWGR